ncbi:MAG: Pr6Pr family membrane protein [Sphingomonadales bacterium]|nr:Pr6Pr family membrane protein [Sphingomonadaceae bacterium]MBS3929841.1 Pr6Pr family membrane protein [Sphingomonadales bacterium]
MSTPAARLTAALLSAATLLAMIPPLINNSAEQGGLLAGAWALLRYFTIITNTLVGLVFAAIAWRGSEGVSPRWLGAAMLGIVLVGVVFNLLLGGLTHATMWDWLGDRIHHVVMPVLVPLWWLAFAPKGRFTWSDPLRWALFPLAYAAYIFLRVGLETPGSGIAYPYFFMDADRLGYVAAMLNMAAIALGFVLTGLGVVWLDRRLARG